MSPALPRVSGEEVVRALERAGFERRSTRGSHAKLRHDDCTPAEVRCHELHVSVEADLVSDEKSHLIMCSHPGTVVAG